MKMHYSTKTNVRNGKNQQLYERKHTCVVGKHVRKSRTYKRIGIDIR